VECSNGQTGYGRRRREVASIPADPNKVFEVTMSTYIRVDYKDDNLLEKGRRTFGVNAQSCYVHTQLFHVIKEYQSILNVMINKLASLFIFCRSCVQILAWMPIILIGFLQFSSVLSGRCRNSTLKQDLTISF
jgi:hypothetical protein